MNELLPYELELNQQWIDLPLPDENRAWTDMKRRLDEDKRRVIPFWWTGCAGWGLLGIVLLGLGWWILRPEKWFNQKQRTEKVSPVIEKKNKMEKDTAFNQADTGTTSARNNNDSIPENNKKDTNNDVKTVIGLPGAKKENIITSDAVTTIKAKQGVVSKKKKTGNDQQIDKIIGKKTKKENKDSLLPAGNDKDKSATDTTTVVQLSKPENDPSITVVKTTVVIDSVSQAKNDSTVKKPELPVIAKDKKTAKDSTKKNPMIYSAGIGLYQQLPVDGQKWSPYSSSGRKLSISDYIPSVYLRATKPGKWFLQGEFRYGAPQHTKEFAFRQNIVSDTNAQGQQRTTTTSNTLKKTFYHQAPLSFNYYILPNWSVGAGLQWNHFYSAVVEEEISRRVVGFPLDSGGKLIKIIKGDSASEFKTSYWQAILQTQYQWKRFTFGARYSFGLQPYINFTLPGAVPQEEKNSSLQVYLLFELWRSRKK